MRDSVGQKAYRAGSGREQMQSLKRYIAVGMSLEGARY